MCPWASQEYWFQNLVSSWKWLWLRANLHVQKETALHPVQRHIYGVREWARSFFVVLALAKISAKCESAADATVAFCGWLPWLGCVYVCARLCFIMKGPWWHLETLAKKARGPAAHNLRRWRHWKVEKRWPGWRARQLFHLPFRRRPSTAYSQ